MEKREKPVTVMLLACFVSLVSVLVIIHPLAFNLNSHLALTRHNDFDNDLLVPLWESWYFKSFTPGDYFKNPKLLWHTPLQYYPWGRNLYVLEVHYYVIFVSLLVFWFVGFPAIYNLHLIFFLTLNGVSMALGVWLLTGSKRGALISGQLMAIHPFIISLMLSGQFTHGTTWFMSLLPVFFLAWITRGGRKNLFISSLLLALCTFFYLFHGVFMGMFAGLYGLFYLLFRPGSRRKTLARLLLFSLMFGALAAPIAYPFWLELKTRGTVQGVPRTRIIPWQFPPLTGVALEGTTPVLEETGKHSVAPRRMDMNASSILYSPASGSLRPVLLVPLGLLALALCLPLVFGKDNSKKGRLFLVFAFFFLTMVLGSYVIIPDTTVHLPLPFAFMYAVIPGLSRLTTNFRFVPVALVFLFVSVGFSVARLEEYVKGTGKRWAGTVVLLLLTLYLGRYSNMVRLKALPPIPPSITALAGFPDYGVIDIPLISERTANNLLWYQTTHGKPLLTGAAPHLDYCSPPEFYSFLKQNPFLKKIARLPDCLIEPSSFPHTGLSFLFKHNFRYLILHKHYIDSPHMNVKSAKQRMTLTRLLGKPLLSDKKVDVFDLNVGIVKWLGRNTQETVFRVMAPVTAAAAMIGSDYDAHLVYGKYRY